MNIGQVATASGVSAKMIRHYESLGLIRLVERTGSGYRRFGQADVDTLRFVQRARAAGFSLAEIRNLLALWQDRARSARDVKRLASAHLAALAARIGELQAISAALAHLVEHCHGDERPECPILESFARPAKVEAGTRAAVPARGAGLEARRRVPPRSEPVSAAARGRDRTSKRKGRS